MIKNPSKVIFILETIHIPLWLIKDLCWLFTWRIAGIIIAVPTVLVAFYMVYLTKKDKNRLLPNFSIALWILANANWMIAEFYELPIKNYSAIPFVLGILVFALFFFNPQSTKKQTNKP
ncbi:MAG: hypothetical protein Q8K70_00310 [Bacteroidota bacterium]|nr:hypothetical protein [Bacteroidota bacterium]